MTARERVTIAAGKVQAGDYVWSDRQGHYVPVKDIERDETYVILKTMAGDLRLHNLRAVNVERARLD